MEESPRARETWLIVNADDFGYSSGVNRGIIEAHRHGLVTSASLMVRQAAAEEAAAYARANPDLSLGLHVELRDRWPRRLPRSPSRRREARLQRRAAEELPRQLERFREVVGSDPTHLDSHRHRHREEPLRPLFIELAAELGVPLRQFDPAVRFRGDFYGQVGAGIPNPDAITPAALIELLESLHAGVTELCCHPGYPDGLRSSYVRERPQEVRTLCDAAVRAAVERLGIRLASFHDLSA